MRRGMERAAFDPTSASVLPLTNSCKFYRAASGLCDIDVGPSVRRRIKNAEFGRAMRQ
jgi:hypothetical protein